MKREEVEKEVNDDLEKSSYHQLLVDIHEELLHDGRSLEDNIRHAQKRTMSLFARIGYDSEKAQKQMRNLTYWIIILTCCMINLTVIQVILHFSTYCNS